MSNFCYELLVHVDQYFNDPVFSSHSVVSNVNNWKSYLPFEKSDLKCFLQGKMKVVLNCGFTNKPL